MEMESNSRKRHHSSDTDNEETAEGSQGTTSSSIKHALGNLYQETLQLRSDVKELKTDVHTMLTNQDQLSENLKNIAEMLKKMSSDKSLEKKSASAALRRLVPDDDDVEQIKEESASHLEDPRSNNLPDDDNSAADDLENVDGMLQEQSCQTNPVTILSGDVNKTNAELAVDIKSLLQNQANLAINMKTILNLLQSPSNQDLPVSPADLLQEQQPTPTAMHQAPFSPANYSDDVEEIGDEDNEPNFIQSEEDFSDAPGPSQVKIITSIPSILPSLSHGQSSGPVVPFRFGNSRMVKPPVPKIIPGPSAGTFLVGGDSSLVRDIVEYENILVQIYSKKAEESIVERARGLLRHMFRLVIPPEILATSNVTGKSRDAVTHRWIRVPKIDEALLLPIFNQTRFQFPEFTDWYTDERSRTVQYLNNVCKTVRHSSYNK